MPRVEEAGDHAEENASNESTENTSNPNGTSPGQDSALNRVIQHMSANKVEAGLWLTRVVSVFSTITFFIPIFGASPATAYQRVLLSNAATSALRLHQRLPNFQLNREFFAMLFLEDSAHYLFYSLIFLYNYPISMVLVPVFLFALLHASSYTRRILDQIGPNSVQMVRKLLDKLQEQQTNILRFIACNEIFMMPVIIIMLFTGHSSLLLPFVYYRFLSLRYASRRNPYSRQLFYELHTSISHLCSQPACPEFARNIYYKLSGLISRLAPVVPSQ